MPFTRNNYQRLAVTMLENCCLVIPDLLIKFYSRLGLTEMETLVLIHLMHWRQVEQERFPTPEKISQYMNLDSEEIKNLIASLIEKKLLTVEPYYHPSLGRWQNSFSLAPLWSKLIEVALGEQNSAATSPEEITVEKQGKLFRAFEKEFGRPLSPLESEQLKNWCQNDQVPVELLQEALRRAVLRGILNFRYIDSILRDWQRHNIRSVAEAMAYDEKVKGKRTRASRPSASSNRKDKYRELYRLNPES